MESNEISPAETSEPVQTGEEKIVAPLQAPPPAANLVIHGEKSEREIHLEKLLSERDSEISDAQRGRLEAERQAAEFERENQELKKIPAAPAPVKEKKVKRKLLFPTMFDDDDEEE
jgi:hypothetical protein